MHRVELANGEPNPESAMSIFRQLGTKPEAPKPQAEAAAPAPAPSDATSLPDASPYQAASADAWDVKGMCAVCGLWFYLREEETRMHCEQPLMHVVLHKDEAEKQRKVDEELRLAEEECRRLTLELTRHHLATLIRKYRRTHLIDDYGVEQDAGWFRELRYFVERVMKVEADFPMYAEVFELIHVTVVNEILSETPGDAVAAVDVEKLDPIEFEQYCADVLAANGWTARRTQAVGDQGVDVVAVRDGLRVALQCKLYSTPVGNGAVQEVLAGASYEDAHFACVVSNGSYTPSARALAAASGVALLHYEDLPRLIDVLEQLPPRKQAP